MDRKQSNSERKKEFDQLLLEWEKSGLSKKIFCAQKQINYQTFIGRMMRRRLQTKVPENKFVAVQIDPINGSGIFAEIQLASSRKVIFHQPVNPEFIQAILKC